MGTSFHVSICSEKPQIKLDPGYAPEKYREATSKFEKARRHHACTWLMARTTLPRGNGEPSWVHYGLIYCIIHH